MKSLFLGSPSNSEQNTVLGILRWIWEWTLGAEVHPLPPTAQVI
jgi:hypothetical protein